MVDRDLVVRCPGLASRPRPFGHPGIFRAARIAVPAHFTARVAGLVLGRAPAALLASASPPGTCRAACGRRPGITGPIGPAITGYAIHGGPASRTEATRAPGLVQVTGAFRPVGASRPAGPSRPAGSSRPASPNRPAGPSRPGWRS